MLVGERDPRVSRQCRRQEPRQCDCAHRHTVKHDAYKYHGPTAEDIITSPLPHELTTTSMSTTDPPPGAIANPFSMTDEPLNLLLAMNLHLEARWHIARIPRPSSPTSVLCRTALQTAHSRPIRLVDVRPQDARRSRVRRARSRSHPPPTASLRCRRLSQRAAKTK